MARQRAGGSSTARRAGATLAAVALLLGSLAALGAGPAAAAAGDISTYAGSIGEGPGVQVAQRVRAMVARGTLVYMADETAEVVRVLDTTTGLQRIVAGNGTYDGQGPDALGDGGPATSATLGYVSALALDAAGNLYIADSFHFRIRKLDPAGRITIVAGNGIEADTGDGGPARAASFSYMWALTFDPAGNLYVSTRARIRRIDTTGTVTTAVGVGPDAAVTASSPDGTPPTQAHIGAFGLVTDAAGSLYFTDGFAPQRIRKVSPAGVLSTVAYVCGIDLVFDAAGNLYVTGCDRVSRIDPAGVVTTFAGTGAGASSADGGPAVRAALNAPEAIALDAAGNVYVAEVNNYRVRRVDRSGIISTVAGNGTFSFAGDGGPATRAQFSSVTDVARDTAGNVYVADWANQRVRRIDPSGTISTFAGTGADATSGDGGPATSAALSYPSDVAVDTAGNVYIASYLGFRIRKVDVHGVISTVAGTGTMGHTGDGGPAAAATIGYTGGLAVDPAGNLYITDNGNHLVRRVDPSGVISTVAGTGVQGFSGDGGPATAAQLYYPNGLALDAAGNLFIADTFNNRIRKVTPDGRITTFANEFALGITSDRAGGLFAAAYGWVDRITPVGTVRVAGTGVEGFAGDGGPATAAQLYRAGGLAFDGTDLYVADSANFRVRRVSAAAGIVPPGSPLRAFGLNHVGQVGSGTPSQSAPSTQPVGLGPAIAVASGYYHSLAVAPDRSVRAWGWNYFGQLGDGSTIDRACARRVSGLSGVVAVAGGATHSLALKDDGTVWAWGFNGVGQLGTGSTTDSRAPVQVPGLTQVVAIAAGAFDSLAVRADGTVWSWGWNGFGGLGDGTNVDRWSPVQVPGLASVTSVASGAYHSLAVTVDGSVWAWGWNALGQLGTGGVVDVRSPVKIVGLSGIATVAGGMAHSMALGRDGRVWAWGWNALGQLGTGSTADARNPVVIGVTGGHDLAAGAYHSVVALDDGTVRAWGWNQLGQVGTTAALEPWPVAVPGLTGVTDVAAGVADTLAR